MKNTKNKQKPKWKTSIKWWDAKKHTIVRIEISWEKKSVEGGTCENTKKISTYLKTITC